MALFDTKKKKEDTKSSQQSKGGEKALSNNAHSFSYATKPLKLIRPRITEKAAYMSDQHAYVFDVKKSASKKEIKDAIVEIYGKTPIKIRTVSIPPKKVVFRGKEGTRKGGKKAYVFLKKGESIEVM